MDHHQRRREFLRLLAEHHSASIDQLKRWLASSSATVRRDIRWLAERHQLLRIRGGAQRLPQQLRSVELASDAFEDNIALAAGAKRAIARHAAGMCGHGDTVIINGGTTTYGMAEFLPDAQLTILTNSIPMTRRLLYSHTNQIILPGGQVYREQSVILSPFESDTTEHHYASKMFTGVHGISALGLMEADPVLIQAEKRLIGQAEELIVLADSSKFTVKAGLLLCGLDRVSCLITDTGIAYTTVRMLERAGVRVVTVEPDTFSLRN